MPMPSCKYLYTSVCTYTYIYTHYTHTSTYARTRTHTYRCTCMRVYIYIYIYIHNCCQVQSALTILPRSQASGRNQVLRFMHIPKLFGGSLGDGWVWGPEWGLSGNSSHHGSFHAFLPCVERNIVNIVEQFTCAVSLPL